MCGNENPGHGCESKAPCRITTGIHITITEREDALPVALAHFPAAGVDGPLAQPPRLRRAVRATVDPLANTIGLQHFVRVLFPEPEQQRDRRTPVSAERWSDAKRKRTYPL